MTKQLLREAPPTDASGAGGAGGAGGDGGAATVNATQSTTVTNNLTFTDSFNEDNDIYFIKDSFNPDNDGVDNAGGTITDSIVADIEDSFDEADNGDLTLDIQDILNDELPA
ncbi:MAG: hypothetical protein M3460_27890 [Actinomycetota bacterium]|nr:hypothetical protein [Actinomycetota bacterium]